MLFTYCSSQVEALKHYDHMPMLVLACTRRSCSIRVFVRQGSLRCFAQELANVQQGGGNIDPPLVVLGMHKALARQLIATALPVFESALRPRVDILANIGQREC